MPERPAREAMLDSAITLFRERGVAATSLRDVVAHSGAPRGSIYHHFPGGKAQLAEEATQRAGDFIGALLSRLVAGEDPDRAVGSFVDYWSGALSPLTSGTAARSPPRPSPRTIPRPHARLPGSPSVSGRRR